jgi:redox-sensitive bicupin YhaK (pirin superfamily)
MSSDPIIAISDLGFPWATLDPFLFCVHHQDAFPPGNEQMGPAGALSGRNIGSDFSGKDGWNMYHGRGVPGFPAHPHRGFETVTIVREGLIDHFDSMGATARYGRGDTQWLTAGGGILHSEMFPLVERSTPNPTELFQIWLNLPARSKMAKPHFTMLWSEAIPRFSMRDDAGRRALVTCVAGAPDAWPRPAGHASAPPPDSWASRPDADVAIWTISLEAGAHLALPPGGSGSRRALYFFKGAAIAIGGTTVTRHSRIEVIAGAALDLANGDAPTELLLLQGKPIAEPVVNHGPFVMNSAAEIRQALKDYQSTQFGGWPWPHQDPVHPRGQSRFARHADGRVEHPGTEIDPRRLVSA